MLSKTMDYHVFKGPMPVPTDSIEAIGRTLMLRACKPLNRESSLCRTAPAEIAHRAHREHSRVVVLDAYPAEYADSDGLRWLLALRSALATEGVPFHVVSRPQSRVRRNLDLLRADLSLYETVQDALRPAG
jgi:anti-anti-sigma regulatory factor